MARPDQETPRRKKVSELSDKERVIPLSERVLASANIEQEPNLLAEVRFQMTMEILYGLEIVDRVFNENFSPSTEKSSLSNEEIRKTAPMQRLAIAYTAFVQSSYYAIRDPQRVGLSFPEAYTRALETKKVLIQALSAFDTEAETSFEQSVNKLADQKRHLQAYMHDEGKRSAMCDVLHTFHNSLNPLYMFFETNTRSAQRISNLPIPANEMSEEENEEDNRIAALKQKLEVGIITNTAIISQALFQARNEIKEVLDKLKEGYEVEELSLDIVYGSLTLSLGAIMKAIDPYAHFSYEELTPKQREKLSKISIKGSLSLLKAALENFLTNAKKSHIARLEIQDEAESLLQTRQERNNFFGLEQLMLGTYGEAPTSENPINPDWDRQMEVYLSYYTEVEGKKNQNQFFVIDLRDNGVGIPGDFKNFPTKEDPEKKDATMGGSSYGGRSFVKATNQPTGTGTGLPSLALEFGKINEKTQVMLRSWYDDNGIKEFGLSSIIRFHILPTHSSTT